MLRPKTHSMTNGRINSEGERIAGIVAVCSLAEARELWPRPSPPGLTLVSRFRQVLGRFLQVDRRAPRLTQHVIDFGELSAAKVFPGGKRCLGLLLDMRGAGEQRLRRRLVGLVEFRVELAGFGSHL